LKCFVQYDRGQEEIEREYDPANDVDKWTEAEDSMDNKGDGGDSGSREDVLWTIGWEQFVREVCMYVYLYVYKCIYSFEFMY
jgi:hypothetical protein